MFGNRYDYLLPVLTVRRFQETDGRTTLSIAVQAKHVACDGFHVARPFQSPYEILAK